MKTYTPFGISGFYYVTFLFLAITFVVFPKIDIWAAGLFCDPTDLFYKNTAFAARAIYRSVEILTTVLAICLIVLVAVTTIKRKPVLKLTQRQIVYLILALALGPGLVVNLFAKNMMGRARPAQIEQFGGSQTFTPAFVMSSQCERNCSFVSGHAALGFYLISFSFIMRHHRKKAFAAAVAYGCAVGIVRMYQGGHFLSDVIFAFCFVYFVSKSLYHLMFERCHA